ncbi:MAG: hypothetical protein JSS22_12235 [Proteobacteria bacterium]|nr:hypothetical protein [Pseudomonadota bacterium]
MTDNLSYTDDNAQSDGLLDVGALCRMFEESDDATYSARQLSERDRDYYDGRQWTDDEVKTLKKRRQPIITDNIIKTKVDFLDGVEKQQRIDPKALPRTPKHEQDADGATDALRYVAEEQNYDKKRSGVWRNLLVEGAGGVAVSVKHGIEYGGQPGVEIEIKRVPWDRMFFDPHSSEPDFSDAGYLGMVIWMNYDDALAMYPEGKGALDTTLSSAPSQTYDDKPKFTYWADSQRKRVRICQIWIKRDEEWHFAEFTKGGILKAGQSPYVTDKGESDCELIFQSAYVDRDNQRYGFVREMISLQDEVNKRRSKALHLLNTNQLHYEQGAVDDIEVARREINRPDGTIEYAPGAMQDKKIQIVNGVELAKGQFELLQEAKNAIDLKGPNATEMGDKTGGSNAASGRAILASQQGGMTQLTHLTDRLQDMDKRVFRAVWCRIRQFWNAEKWVRVTDDEQNVKWVGINADPQQVQMAIAQNPAMQDKIKSVVGNVAELDCDIIIDEAPDSLTPQLEQFQSLVELKKFDAGNEIPFKSIVRASPNLKVKQQILKDIEQREQQQQQQQQPVQQLQFRGAVAEVQNKEADTAKKLAEAHSAGAPGPATSESYELPPEIQNAQAVADIDDKTASAQHKRAQAVKALQEASLAPERLAKEVQQERSPA